MRDRERQGETKSDSNVVKRGQPQKSNKINEVLSTAFCLVLCPAHLPTLSLSIPFPNPPSALMLLRFALTEEMEKEHNLNIIRRRRIQLNRGKRIERRCARQGQMASKSSQEWPEGRRTQMSDSIIYLLQIKGTSSGSRKRSPRASPSQVKCQHK